MAQAPRVVLGFLASFVCPAAASAAGFTLVHHGGRATAQAGAFTARASDPSAVRYNPAAITRLEGFQLQLGLGFAQPRDTVYFPPETFHLPRPDYAAEGHVTTPPAAYLTWRRARSRWALGLGLDSPVWHRQDWPVRLPSTYRTRAFEVELLQLHPVAAFAVDERWSVGAGICYLSGRLRDAYETTFASGRAPNTYFVFGERSAMADVGGWAADASLSFHDAVWGFGAVVSSGAKLYGTADVDVRLANAGPPVAAPRIAASIAYLLEDAPRGLGIDLAPELRVGAWIAPTPRLRLELDLAFARWSKTGWDRPREVAACGAPCRAPLPRDWRDTLSIRLGAERRGKLRPGASVPQPGVLVPRPRQPPGLGPQPLLFARERLRDLGRLAVLAHHSNRSPSCPWRGAPLSTLVLVTCPNSGLPMSVTGSLK